MAGTMGGKNFRNRTITRQSSRKEEDDSFLAPIRRTRMRFKRLRPGASSSPGGTRLRIPACTVMEEGILCQVTQGTFLTAITAKTPAKNNADNAITITPRRVPCSF